MQLRKIVKTQGQAMMDMKYGRVAGESLKSRPILWSIAGDTGEGAREWLKFLLMKDFQLPHLKILFPTAPQRPYTPLGGEVRICY
jgi:hypothetical protein